MSQKLIYRTACVIVGFGIGVVYFASPNSNTRLVEADGLTEQDKVNLIQTQQEENAETDTGEMISLEQEAKELAAIEAKIVEQLKSESASMDVADNANETLPSELDVSKTELSSKDNEVSSTQKVTTAKSKQADLELIAEELEEQGPNKAGTSTQVEDERSDARAQLRRSSTPAPSRITRKVYLVEEEGADLKEKILEIDVASVMPGPGWVEFAFGAEEVASRIKVKPKAQVSQKTSDTKVKPVLNDKVVSPEILQDVNHLKDENLELREQVLSLKVMMQAMQADSSGIVSKEKSLEPESKLPAAMSSNNPKPEEFFNPDDEYREHDYRDNEWSGDEDLPMVKYDSGAQRITNGPPNESLSNESVDSRLGDPVLVRYQRTPLRTGPGTNYSRVTVLQKGTVLTVDYHRNGWFRVYTADGVRAWISQEAVERF